MSLPSTGAALVALALGAGPGAMAGPDPEAVALVVQAGTPLRVALDQRVKVKHVGQAVTATVVEPVYAFDRIVVPAGARVVGHLEKLEGPSKGTRLRAMLGGDFTPSRKVVLNFNALVLPDGEAYPIDSVVTNGAEDVTLQLAGASDATGVVARARQEIAQKAKGVVTSVKQPGKLRRLKEWLRDTALGILPVHPQFMRKDTVYSVKLLTPVSFGTVTAAELAPPDVAPAPGSILTARLVTPLDSATTPRATPIEAVVTQPVFSADHRLILPEGAKLTGEVTFAKSARHFHRNGQLRILFEAVQVPDRTAEQLRASLYSIEAGRAARVAVDEEGGATAANSSKRFAAPALASLALVASLHRRLDYDTDGAGAEVQYGSGAAHGVGGFYGLGLVGVGAAQLSRPFALGLAIIGVARTLYGSVAGKGQEVSFPADTPIQVRLAPGPSSRPPPTPSPTPSPPP
jgi:hypothetical protein